MTSDHSARAAVVADRLHSLSIHLLRRLRREDGPVGLSAPQLSALSVVVFGGPLSLGELAAAEQVRPPTMSRLVRQLEAAGLIQRAGDADDGRVVLFLPTDKGVRVLQEGRWRRVAALARQLDDLDAAEFQSMETAVAVLQRLLGLEVVESGGEG